MLDKDSLRLLVVFAGDFKIVVAVNPVDETENAPAAAAASIASVVQLLSVVVASFLQIEVETVSSDHVVALAVVVVSAFVEFLPPSF
jgi:hypothetical protein